MRQRAVRWPQDNPRLAQCRLGMSGDGLRAVRAILGLSQRDLAKRLKRSVWYANAVENETTVMQKNGRKKRTVTPGWYERTVLASLVNKAEGRRDAERGTQRGMGATVR